MTREAEATTPGRVVAASGLRESRSPQQKEDQRVTKETKTKPLSSPQKTLALLDAVAGSVAPAQVAELSRLTGIRRAAVHQHLVTLVASGWLERLDDHSYRLTLHAARVGQAALEQAGIGTRLMPALQELMEASDEAVSLAVLDGGSAHIIERAEPGRPVRVDTRNEAHMPLASSASGRILLAFATDFELQGLRRSGVATLDDEEREGIRETGWASSVGEWLDGVHAVAVPLFESAGRCIAALSVAAPAPRFDAERLARLLMKHAAAMNEQLSA
jgi:DNA-binding IclR family transcriptional regulator